MEGGGLIWRLLLCELLLGLAIISFRGCERHLDTEIDWKAYMQEVQGFLEGDFNYTHLKGDTGPLVYPAGFLYFFSALYYLCSSGTHIQWLFLCLYLVNQYALLRIYERLWTEKTVTLPALIMLSLSYRVHSIFLLRMFNDPVAVTLLHWSVWLIIQQHWSAALVLYSLALSVKMNILLYLPGVLLLLLIARGPVALLGGVLVIISVQGVLAAPFLASFPSEYFARAFEFTRQFDMKWSVNFQFLPLETFSDPGFHRILLLFHLFLLLLFLFLQGSAGSSLKQRLQSINLSFQWEENALSATEIVQTLFTINLIGIACCRSLHYQFYSWYFFTIPYFVWNCRPWSVGNVVKLGCWGVMEGVYMRYPPFGWGSGALQVAHWTLVVRTMQVLALAGQRKLPTVERLTSDSKPKTS